jgi:acyl carrier protein
MLISRGANHYPQDIEITVERCHPALRAAGCAAFCVEAEGEERLVVAQELQRTALQSDLNEIYTAIRAAIAEEHGIQVHAIALLKPGSIPKTTSGKIQRSACRTAWLNGDLNLTGAWQQAPRIAPMPPESEPVLAVVGPSASRRPLFVLPSEPEEQLPALEAYLHARVQRLLGLAPEETIARNRSLSGVGLDSLMVVELKNRIEQDMKVAIPMSLLMQGPSLAQLAAFLHEQLVPRGPMSPAPRPLTPSAVANLSDAEVDRLLGMLMQSKM